MHTTQPTGFTAPTGRPAGSPPNPDLERVQHGDHEITVVGRCRLHGRPADPAAVLEAFRAQGLVGLRPLDGPFALEIVDARADSVTLVQGPLAEESLYVRKTHAGVAWSTRLQPLLGGLNRPSFDGEALREVLNYRWCLGDRSLVAGIEQLQPGTAATFADGALTRKAVQDLRHEAAPMGHMNDWVEGLVAALRDELRGALSGSVAPVVLLSGGVDSGLLAALTREIRPDAVALTPTWADGTDHELPRARRMAEHLGMQHRTLRIDNDELRRAAADITGLLEVPPKDHWAIGLMATFRRLEGSADLVIHGAGADMIMGSRSRERIAEANRLARLRSLIPPPLRRAVARRLPLDRSHLGDLRAILEEDPRKELVRMGLIDFDRGLRHRHHRIFGDGDPAPSLVDRFESPRGNAYEGRLRMSLYTWVRAHTFEVTRLAGASGLSTTYPFMAPPALTWAFTLPPERAYDRQRVRKPVIRAAYARYFPEEWSRWPKLGFQTPTELWHQGCLREWVDERLGPGSVGDRLLGPGLEAFDVGRDYQHMLALACLEDFAQRFGVELHDS